MSSEIERIEATYRRYFETFQGLDARAILPYYHVPCMFVSSAGVFALANAAEAEAFFGRMLHALQGRGYARSELAQLQTRQLSAELALISIRGARYKADGSLLEALVALYTLRKVEGAWRIAVATVYEPSHAIEFAAGS